MLNVKVANAVRLRLNEKAGGGDKFSAQILGHDVGLSHWNHGPFIIIKVSEQKFLVDVDVDEITTDFSDPR